MKNFDCFSSPEIMEDILGKSLFCGVLRHQKN